MRWHVFLQCRIFLKTLSCYLANLALSIFLNQQRFHLLKSCVQKYSTEPVAYRECSRCHLVKKFLIYLSRLPLRLFVELLVVVPYQIHRLRLYIYMQLQHLIRRIFFKTRDSIPFLLKISSIEVSPLSASP